MRARTSGGVPKALLHGPANPAASISLRGRPDHLPILRNEPIAPRGLSPSDAHSVSQDLTGGPTMIGRTFRKGTLGKSGGITGECFPRADGVPLRYASPGTRGYECCRPSTNCQVQTNHVTGSEHLPSRFDLRLYPINHHVLVGGAGIDLPPRLESIGRRPSGQLHRHTTSPRIYCCPSLGGRATCSHYLTERYSLGLRLRFLASLLPLRPAPRPIVQWNKDSRCSRRYWFLWTARN